MELISIGLSLQVDREFAPYMPSVHVVSKAMEAAYQAMVKHGVPSADPVRGCGIIAEEVGEAMAHALDLTPRTTPAVCGQPERDQLLLMLAELAQVAGSALLRMEQIYSGKTFEWLQIDKQRPRI